MLALAFTACALTGDPALPLQVSRAVPSRRLRPACPGTEGPDGGGARSACVGGERGGRPEWGADAAARSTGGLKPRFAAALDSPDRPGIGGGDQHPVG